MTDLELVAALRVDGRLLQYAIADRIEALVAQVAALTQRAEQAEALLRRLIEASDDEFFDRTYEGIAEARVLLGMPAAPEV